MKKKQRSYSRKQLKTPTFHVTFSREGVRTARVVKGATMVVVAGHFKLGRGAKEILLPKKLGVLYMQRSGAMLVVDSDPSLHGTELFLDWLVSHVDGPGLTEGSKR